MSELVHDHAGPVREEVLRVDGARLGLEREVVDRAVYDRAVGRFREAGIRLPTFAELSEPSRIPPAVEAALASADPDVPQRLNVFVEYRVKALGVVDSFTYALLLAGAAR